MDLDNSADPVVHEFIGVVLAGFGAQLGPLTSPHGNEACPKALLPVANRPILDYTLAWLEESGIRDVLLICPQSHRDPISLHIHSTTFPSLNVDLQTYDDEAQANTGTVGILKHFAHRIQRDFVLLPCDLIPPPSVPLRVLLNKFRIDTVTDGTLAVSFWFRQPPPDPKAEQWDPSTSTTIIWDKPSTSLLHVETLSDQDRYVDEMELRMGLLTRYPHTTLLTNMQDSHVYVCRNFVFHLLRGLDHLESFREDFIPWMCKIRYQESKRQKCLEILKKKKIRPLQPTALDHSTTYTKPFPVSTWPDEPTEEPRSVPHPATGGSLPPSPLESEDDTVPASANAQAPPPSLNINVVVCPTSAGFISRVNTLDSFIRANQNALTTSTHSLPSNPEDRALIDQQAQISADSIVGHSTRVSKSAVIKASVVGKHCVVGEGATLVRCVLLDHCVIGTRAKLDGCVLGKYSKVGDNAVLHQCVTQTGYEVSNGEELRNERLETTDWMHDSEEEE